MNGLQIFVGDDDIDDDELRAGVEGWDTGLRCLLDRSGLGWLLSLRYG
jgi:hypothetical protein